MKTQLKLTSIILVLMLIFFLDGCTNSDDAVSPIGAPSGPTLSKEQHAVIYAQADKVAKDAVEQLNSQSNQRSPNGYDYIELNVTGVSGTGPISALYGFSSGVRNPALLNPAQLANYSYVFCAAASHFRYGIIYFYNGYTHTATSIDAIYGPTGGCLTGSKSFSVNIGGPNTSQTFVIVFDVLNGPGGGATQIAGPIWSNERELTYPSYHILNPGYYWY